MPFWKFYDERHPDYRPAADVFDGRDPLLEALRASTSCSASSSPLPARAAWSSSWAPGGTGWCTRRCT